MADLVADNADALLRGADLVLDGTDNFETRFLVNDVCVRDGMPWVYGACVGSYGLALLVRPRVTPCLRCLLEERPAPGSGPTCDTAGVVAPIVHVVAGIQARGGAEAPRRAAPRRCCPALVTVDLWQGSSRSWTCADARPGARPAPRAASTTRTAPARRAAVLCGRDAVQVRGRRAGARVDLGALAERLRAVGRRCARQRVPRALRGRRTRSWWCSRTAARSSRACATSRQARALYAKYVGA